MQCQIDEIYKHELNENCEANVADLSYDYRTTINLYFGFIHEHGPPGEDGFDENGHFGAIPGCEGRVIHFVEDDHIVFDGPVSPVVDSV